MENTNQLLDEVSKLKNKVNSTILPPDLLEKVRDEINRLERMVQLGSFSEEFLRVSRYVDWICALPWNKRSDDILDLNFAKQILDRNHYGLVDVKERVLEYISVLSLRKQRGSIAGEKALKFMRAPILCFVGLVGTGKTTIAYSIAEAMGRKIERVPFGGLGDPLYLRGQSRVHPDSDPGQIIKALRRAGTKNPVILLDEIDRVVDTSRASIMGVLVELLDPEQNMAFNDHFIDFPIDLSEVLFIATCNNTTNISTAVIDRLEPIQMPSYTDEEKIAIAKNYVLPQALEESGLTMDNVVIDDSVWTKIVRPLGFDAGIRTLERTISGVCRKVAKAIVEKKGTRFQLTEANIREFLPA